MSQERKSFTVSDRRHFTSEGQPREEAAADPPAPETATETAPEPPPADKRVPSASPAEFGSFLLSLAAQASYLLAAEGEDAKGSVDEARYLISVLEMLKDKTEGRRTADEDQILDNVLYELRLGYVARTRAGGA